MDEKDLTEYERKVLRALDGPGGFTTGAVASLVTPRFGHNTRIHSAAVRQWLLHLERLGMVGRLDDQKPTCWTIIKERPC
jgi:hypothetical protein